MKKHILLILLALMGIAAKAQAPAGYYNNANGKTGTALRQALHDIIDDHTSISYDAIWGAFYNTDHRTDQTDKVWDIYSDIPGGTPKLFTLGDGQCGTYTQEGQCYNREHSWPKSWFDNNENSTPGRDLHHIFPTDGYVNAQRSNYPYGEVQTATYTSHNGSKLGSCKSSLGYNGTVFEPIDEYKGDIARAYFYMSTRYYGEDSDWGSSGMTERANLKPWAIAMLLAWNDADPVSQKEIDRNNVIYTSYQHNRNPFIDNPEYARMIWDPTWTPSITANGDFVKVTTVDDITDGEYLIVCENNNVAFNGALSTLDATNNNISVTISNGTIASSAETNAATFTITAKTGGYSIKSASGYFIGNNSDANTLLYSLTEEYVNAISITEGNADVVISSSHLRYNNADNQKRFRYYKSASYSNQQSIQLYKKIETVPETPLEQKYYLVTSTDQLVVGRTYLIVNIANQKALGKTQNGNNRSAADVSIANGIIETLGDACELRLGGAEGAWTLFDATNNSGYLYAAGGTSNNNNYLKTQTTLTDAGRWTITLDANNKATIKTIDATVVKHTIWFNKSSNIFSCYSTTQQDVYLFIRSEENDYTSNTTLACLNSFDKSIIHSGVTVTANNVLGINQTTDPSLVIIEDGAQLYHNADGLKATLKKTVAAYSDNGGWYTIATPFASFSPTDTPLTGDTYDLYAYDEDGQAEWINYKANTTTFKIDPGMGYLYAHKPTASLRTTGTLNNGNAEQVVNLSYGNTNDNIKGYNLLGNPTAHNITFNKDANVSDGYYYLNNSENWVYQTGNSVPVGRGFLVKANASGQSVTLNPQSKDTRNDKEEYIVIDIDGEKAYVKLNDGVSMPLLGFRDRHSSLWIEHDGQPYIMLVRDDANSIELNYKAQQYGQHLLRVDTKGLDLEYLHLIDRMTGADIDLLVTPSYTFESKTSDYASRFCLAFDANASAGSASETDNFAFISNGEIIVNGTGTLQVIDMLGRQVYSREATSDFRLPTSDFSNGVYVLQLVNGNGIKIQKIVVPQ